MHWLLFIRNTTTPCEPFRYIFIKDNSLLCALDNIRRKIFTCGCKHDFFWDEYIKGNSKQEVWDKSVLAKKHCSYKNVDDIIFCSDVLVIDESKISNRIVMPDGTDGLLCEGECKEFWPYVEKNMDDKFICIKCR